MYLIETPPRMYDNLFSNIMGREPKKIGDGDWLTERPLDDILDKATLTGMRVRPILHRPTQTDDKKGIVAGEPLNDERINYLRSFRDGIYGNVAFMGKLLYLHEALLGRTSNVVDLFFGHGGTAIAGLEYGLVNVVGLEKHYPNFMKSCSNVESYLRDNGFMYRSEDSRAERHFRLRSGAIHIYFADSTSSLSQIIDELKLPGFSIISDIPWGKYDRANNGQPIRDMGRFLADVSETIACSGAKTAAVSHHSDCGLKIEPASTLATPDAFSFSFYSFPAVNQ